MGDNKRATRKSVRFASTNSERGKAIKSEKCTFTKTEESAFLKTGENAFLKTQEIAFIKTEESAFLRNEERMSIKTEKYTSKKSLRAVTKKSDKVITKRSDKVICRKSNRLIINKRNNKTTSKKNYDKDIFKNIDHRSKSKNDDNEIIPKTITPCEYCDLNTTSINDILAKSAARHSIVYDFLCQHGVAVNSFKCLKCGRDCYLNLTSKLFLCNKSAQNSSKKKQFCNFKISVFKGTFFYKARLSYVKVFEFVYLYLYYPVKGRSHVIIKQLSIGPNTFTDWANFVREVLMHYSRHNSQPIGGPNIIVEIEEVKFGANKCNRFGGIPDQWIIAGVERGNWSKQFVVAMPQNDAETLNNILKQYIKPKSIVNSGIMESFKNLSNEEFHLAFNHNINFVYSGTDNHTENVKSLLIDLRKNIPEFGQKVEHFNGYLAEARFRLIFPKPGERFHHFWKATGNMFPPMV